MKMLKGPTSMEMLKGPIGDGGFLLWSSGEAVFVCRVVSMVLWVERLGPTIIFF